jgi:type IV fimbrial biogenesis protein FimT
VDRMSPKFSCRGFTLIELMITLVILGVTVTLATPAMQHVIQGSRLRTETTRLLDAINLARSEAVLRNVAVSLCPSSMADSGVPDCAGDFNDGWIVFTNRNRDRIIDAGSDRIIRAFEAIPPGYSVTNLAGSRPIEELITYLPDGSSRRNMSLLLCPPNSNRIEPWRVVLNQVGRARAAKAPAQCTRSLL